MGTITAVSRSGRHSFTKPNESAVHLLAGLGVDGDAHQGVTVRHRYRVRRDPTQPNLRQVHLMHAELHDELNSLGFEIQAGQLGENITTRGIDLLALPTGTRLHLGRQAVVEVTGLRNPCKQIEAFRKGLLSHAVDRHPKGTIVRKTGIMSIVLEGGEVRPGDSISIELPPEPHRPLVPV
ncbi:MOSC domain-containing protein [Rhodococcus tibetensis]|uniref:MOSC domain-containing protein n=1 Tax=Rhodococcus tibetensis TaxID=2965064 RepID=A0ABT1QH86_9NOCA|nr:MOSC domain-containing protein [Rhodococcus sp. FXJ9.536]MCQ4121610.1 MOSC domain-containing protein [Rhodococcus sp. FXJ9.536]